MASKNIKSVAGTIFKWLQCQELDRTKEVGLRNFVTRHTGSKHNNTSAPASWMFLGALPHLLHRTLPKLFRKGKSDLDSPCEKCK